MPEPRPEPRPEPGPMPPPVPAAQEPFAAACRRLGPRLMRDLGLSELQAAGLLGNLGRETGGFRHLQEVAPAVPGSRGGWGLAQWTGSRRVAMETWCRARGLDPADPEAGYGYLCAELRGPDLGHHGPAARQGDDHAVLFEPAQRLAHRLGGDAEFRRDGALGDLAAGGQHSLHDGFAQAPVGAFAEGKRVLLGQRGEPLSGCLGGHGQLP